MYEAAAAERYVDALIREISAWNEVEAGEAVDTIYFGGGTPSLLRVDQLDSVLNAVRKRFAVEEDVEITLEINPGDGGVDRQSRLATMREWRALGINRASFGAQTFDDQELKMLGRTHNAASIHQTFAVLRDAGFANINFDLIAGLPSQTLAGWKENLKRALELRPEHLSLYLLDLHEGTPLHNQIERGMRPKTDEDLAAEMYSVMIEQVCAAGYEYYEISNFCLPGFASRHNTKYWLRAPYYGFGNSAHSHDGALRRWANERDPLAYVKLIERSESPIVERSELSDEDARSETIFLGLRLMRGVALADYQSRYGRDLREQSNGELDRLQDAGLIEIDSEVLKLTKRGALLSNEVFAVFG
jgi:oxygen-independent coproporphyrinogen-3 oxidase